MGYSVEPSQATVVTRQSCSRLDIPHCVVKFVGQHVFVICI